MCRKSPIRWVVVGVFGAVVGGGAAPVLGGATLGLGFDGAGGVRQVSLHGEELALSGPGGFAATEVVRDRNVARSVLYRNDFGPDAPPWSPTANAHAEQPTGAVAMAEEGESFVRVGEGKRFGHGLAPVAPVAMAPHTRCEISWRGRIPDGESSFIVYVRIFDRDGRDITREVGAPSPWTYSIYTHTHYRNLVAPGKAEVWETLRLSYQMPESAHFLLPAICLWRGTHADVDDLTVTQMDRTLRRDVVFDRRSVEATAEGTRIELASSESGLAVRASVRVVGECVQVEAELADLAVPPRPRGVLLRFALPVALADWTWHRHWREDRPIMPDSLFSNTESIGGHPVSFYPFTAVSQAGVGLALGTPFRETPIEHRRVTADGLATEYALGLLPHGEGTPSAKVRFLLFPFRGEWGFRSAAKAYYAMHEAGFRPRTKREGLWVFPIPPSQLPSQPEDFGFAFWEGWSKDPEEQERARELGISIHPYTEAWGMRQGFPEAATATDLPPVPERLAQLEEWAASETPDCTWFGAPRHLAARAALRSLPVCPDGSHPFAVDKYSVWSHWWRTNPDPGLPPPNRATLCWDYRIAPTLPQADGIYLDSLSYGFAVNYLNVRPEHLAIMADPLTFDPATGQPAADGIQHQVAFVRWLEQRLHADGKLIQGNVFGIAHRFNAPFLDVLGSEVGSFGGKRHMDTIEGDETCCLKRFHANRRPVCNLLQEGNFHNPVPAVSQAEMRRYLDHQLFYGFYPGVATIGGEEKPGYADWKRYFRGDSQCGRDRELFREVVPLVRRLNQAGWQPETGLRCEPPTVLAERYGAPGKGETLFALRNPTARDVVVGLRFDPVVLGEIGEFLSLRTGRSIAAHGPAACTITLASGETEILRMQ